MYEMPLTRKEHMQGLPSRPHRTRNAKRMGRMCQTDAHLANVVPSTKKNSITRPQRHESIAPAPKQPDSSQLYVNKMLHLSRKT